MNEELSKNHFNPMTKLDYFLTFIFPVTEFNKLHKRMKSLQLSRIKDYNLLILVDNYHKYYFYGTIFWSTYMGYELFRSYKDFSFGARKYMGRFQVYTVIRTYIVTNLCFFFMIYKFGNRRNQIS
jgi:hypothetical protein